MNEKIFDQYILNTGLVDKKQLRQARKYDPDLFVEESLEKLEREELGEAAEYAGRGAFKQL